MAQSQDLASKMAAIAAAHRPQQGGVQQNLPRIVPSAKAGMQEKSMQIGVDFGAIERIFNKKEEEKLNTLRELQKVYMSQDPNTPEGRAIRNSIDTNPIVHELHKYAYDKGWAFGRPEQVIDEEATARVRAGTAPTTQQYVPGTPVKSDEVFETDYTPANYKAPVGQNEPLTGWGPNRPYVGDQGVPPGKLFGNPATEGPAPQTPESQQHPGVYKTVYRWNNVPLDIKSQQEVDYWRSDPKARIKSVVSAANKIGPEQIMAGYGLDKGDREMYINAYQRMHAKMGGEQGQKADPYLLQQYKDFNRLTVKNLTPEQFSKSTVADNHPKFQNAVTMAKGLITQALMKRELPVAISTYEQLMNWHDAEFERTDFKSEEQRKLAQEKLNSAATLLILMGKADTSLESNGLYEGMIAELTEKAIKASGGEGARVQGWMMNQFRLSKEEAKRIFYMTPSGKMEIRRQEKVAEFQRNKAAVEAHAKSLEAGEVARAKDIDFSGFTNVGSRTSPGGYNKNEAVAESLTGSKLPAQLQKQKDQLTVKKKVKPITRQELEELKRRSMK